MLIQARGTRAHGALLFSTMLPRSRFLFVSIYGLSLNKETRPA